MSDPSGAAVRQRWALAAAVVVVLVVIGVVVAFGLVPYPDLPTVAEQPDPPVSAQLAYIRYEDTGQCLHVVDGQGQDRELGCGGTYEGDLVWLPDGRLGVQSYRAMDSVIDVVDPATGEVVDQITEEREEPAWPGGFEPRHDDGRRVTTGNRDGRFWVEVTAPGQNAQRVLELEGPSSYRLHDAGWSDDGEWIVVHDSIGRILVVDADGRTDARIWADDVGSVAVR